MADLAEVIVIGAGPAGLASAYCLSRTGLAVRVLERADRVASSWHGHYDGLRLNSGRIISSLPGLRLDRRCGRFVHRDDFIRYLDRYADRLDVPIEFGTRVRHVVRHDGGWLVRASDSDHPAKAVVVATGLNAIPIRPAWADPGTFNGELLYARDYRDARPYRDRDVLVVGAGPTAHDIALHLVAAGAARVRISVRTPPILVPRQMFGLSTAWMSHAIKHGRPALPRGVHDRLSLWLQRICYPDATRYFGTPPAGLLTAMEERGRGLALEVGLLKALRRGEATVVPAVARLDGSDVVLADDQRIQPDTVILATGHRTGLEPLVGHLDVLGPAGRPLVHGAETLPHAPDLQFIGFRLPAGQLPDMGHDARAIARRLARSLSRREAQKTATTEDRRTPDVRDHRMG